jgi:phospholipid/cholesterol/gamma-HCH transport system permease protein
MQDAAHFSLDETGANGTRLVLSGQLVLAQMAPLERDLKRLAGAIAAIDLAGVEDIDTVGAWVVCRIAAEHGAQITGAGEAAERLLAAVRDIEPAATSARRARRCGNACRYRWARKSMPPAAVPMAWSAFSARS